MAVVWCGAGGPAGPHLTLLYLIVPLFPPRRTGRYLNGDVFHSHEAATRYIDPGVHANDTVDKDISYKVNYDVPVNVQPENYPSSYNCIYNVEDLRGNKAQPIGRVVVVDDTIPPSVFLFGESTIDVEGGSRYLDQSALGNDLNDGDVTDSLYSTVLRTSNRNCVKLNGGCGSDRIVDTMAPAGTIFIIDYHVNDRAGNGASARRFVRIKDTKKPWLELNGPPVQRVEGKRFPALRQGQVSRRTCRVLLTPSARVHLYIQATSRIQSLVRVPLTSSMRQRRSQHAFCRAVIRSTPAHLALLPST